MAGRLDELGDELVHIFVGPERKKFSVHKNLICRSGDFFKAAFQDNGFEEGAEDKMDLPEDEPYVFQGFVTWMYTAQVGRLRNPTERVEYDCLLAIIDLYIFADKYQSVQLMESVMDSLQDILIARCNILSFREVERVFEFTKSRSNHPLRRFAIALMACDVSNGTTDSSLQKMERIFREIDGALIATLECIPLLLLTDEGEHQDPRFRTDDTSSGEGFGICEFHLHKLDEACNSSPNQRETFWL